MCSGSKDKKKTLDSPHLLEKSVSSHNSPTEKKGKNNCGILSLDMMLISYWMRNKCR